MSEPTVPPPPSYPPPPPPSSGMPGGTGGTVSPNRTIMIVLSYLGILALIPLLMEKEDREVQWHAKHGLVLFVTWFALSIVLGFFSFVDFFGCTGCVMQWILGIVALIVHIMAIIKGVNGQRLIIPGLSDFANRF